jgi:hypothetical protein
MAPDSRAEEPEPVVAFLTGASVLFAGFAVGAVVLAAGGGGDAANNAGWMTTEAGFVLAPVASHVVVGEWQRALAFGATPAATMGGTGVLLAMHPSAIAHGELAEQRVLWSLFGLGLLSSAVGVVDSALWHTRHTTVTAAPIVGSDQFGLELRGTL